MSLKKIMVKSTTSLSINERFTYLRRNPEPAVAPIQRIRAANVAQQQASVKNRRLAQQMERRPAVMAALKIKRRTLRQRLGQTFDGAEGASVKDRLTLYSPNIRGSFRGRGRGRGGFRGRGGRGGQSTNRPNQMVTLNRSPGFGAVTTVSRSVPLRRGLAMQARVQRPFRGGRGMTRGQVTLSVGLRGRGFRALRGASPRGQFRGRSQFRGVQTPRGYNQVARGLHRGNVITPRGGRGVPRRGRGVLQARGVVFRGRGGVRGRGVAARGTRVGRGLTRGRGRRQNQQHPVSKEELDQQLDQYMSSTRTHLDREMDTYMTDAHSSFL